MARQPQSTEKRKTRAAVLLPWNPARGAGRLAEARLKEAVSLAQAIDLDLVWDAVFPLREIRPPTLFGRGQLEDIGEVIEREKIDLLIVDHPLTPIQQRNLERAFNCKVLDRTGLILDIFGDRAATREGVLQVELAHLQYQRSRLVRLWTHLERQRGGFGFLGGPGETQMEADRRMIDQRLVRLKKDLEQVRRTRGLHRRAREKVPFPVVAFVGYTNAGKSTLFNRLTGSSVMARDQLFATLDPTMRVVRLPSGRRVILSDTVGFISDLPTELVAAFRATLEEVAGADIILHVRDSAHPESDLQKRDVLNVLEDMENSGMLAAGWESRILEVRNKSDLLEGGGEAAGAVSALTGAGVEALLAEIDRRLEAGLEEAQFVFDAGEGKKLAWLHDHGGIVEDRMDEEGRHHLKVRMRPKEMAHFREERFS